MASQSRQNKGNRKPGPDPPANRYLFAYLHLDHLASSTFVLGVLLGVKGPAPRLHSRLVLASSSSSSSNSRLPQLLQ